MQTEPPIATTAEETTHKTAQSWKWTDVLLITLAAILITVAGVFAMSGILQIQNPQADLTSGAPLIFNAALAGVEALALVVGVAGAGLWRRRFGWGAAGLRPASTPWLARAAVLGFVFIPLLGLIALLVQFLLGMPLQNPQLEFLAPKDFSWGGALLMLALGGVVTPFAEELYFRGVLYAWLRTHLPPWLAMLISAALFGALHGEISVAAATFFMGLVLAWFYERSASIWPSVLIHVINNSAKLVLLYVLIAAGVQLP